MGMRFGVIAATGPRADFLAELNRHTGELALDDPLDSPYDAIDEGHAGWELAIGERDGRSFLFDGAMLSDSPDMVHAMSVQLGLVVGAGADTMFGSFWFTAARDGELLRFVYVDAESTTQGMAMGDALASEAASPIDGDFDGEGLFDAMATLGVDPRPWLDSGPAQLLAPVGWRRPEPGEIEQVRSQHIKRYRRV